MHKTLPVKLELEDCLFGIVLPVLSLIETLLARSPYIFLLSLKKTGFKLSTF